MMAWHKNDVKKHILEKNLDVTFRKIQINKCIHSCPYAQELISVSSAATFREVICKSVHKQQND